MLQEQRSNEVEDFIGYLRDVFDVEQRLLRISARDCRNDEQLAAGREEAWRIYRQVFKQWDDVEQRLRADFDPVGLLELRLSVRNGARFDAFRFTNCIDACRLIDKSYPDPARLERADERNPGAPPALCAVYERRPRARGAFPAEDKTFIEMLDHAAMRVQDIDVVHSRTAAAARVLVPRIRDRLADGGAFLLLDVACGGHQLARHVIEALREGGVSSRELERVHILGVDVDERAIPYTFGSSGLGWHDAGRNVAVDVTIGNILDPKTQRRVREWTSAAGRPGFDAVTALGILDYIGCGVPGETRDYIPEAVAPAFGESLRGFVAPGGSLIVAVFAKEGYDAISSGVRSLFANWNIEHATVKRMRERFSFLRDDDFQPLTGRDNRLDAAAHFIVHNVA